MFFHLVFFYFLFHAGKAQDDADFFLLPWNLRPEHYDLTIFTQIEQFDPSDEDTFVYMGIVNITVQVFYGDTSDVVFHRHEFLNILNATVTDLENNEPLTIVGANYEPVSEKQTFTMEPSLKNYGRYLITIYYSGPNTDDLSGFYRSSYYTDDNELKWLLTTDFEPIGARRAFPCFDEPEYKATFKLTVHFSETLRQQGYNAVFNTDLESEQIINGEYVATFQTTPRPLSTYLVAFVISDFTASQTAYFNSSFNGENGTKPYRTIGRAEYISAGYDQLSQTVGPAALNILTKNTKVGYGMLKSEQIGIPDFAAGAMENWGLCTYREEYLFSTDIDPFVTQVIVHELSHQWFGDLVTLYWWSYLWLNEGFATFFEFQASSEIKEEGFDGSVWDYIGQQISDSIHYVLTYDAIRTISRPLSYEAYDPEEISDFFDLFSYDKGGAVIRMWSHALGNDIFYEGLRRYLIFRQESVGTPEILLSSWDGALDGTAADDSYPDLIVNLFQEWHLQAGYPLVTVKRNGNDLILTQSKFSTDDGSRWNIPISYSTDLELNFNNTRPVVFLQATEDSATLTLKSSGAKWVVLNNQQTGYFRVDYDDENWDALLDAVDQPDSPIHPYNRAQILDDYSAVSRAGNRSFKRLLKFLSTLRFERSYAPWKTGIFHIKFLLAQFENEQVFPALKNFVANFTRPAFEELTFNLQHEKKSSVESLLRKELTDLYCSLDGGEHCKKLRHFSSDIENFLLCQNVKENGLKQQTLDKKILKAIPCNRQVLTDVLNNQLLIKRNDLETVIKEAAAKGAESAAVVYEFLSKNPQVIKKFHARDIDKIIINLINNLNSSKVSKLGQLKGGAVDELLDANLLWANSVRKELINFFN